MKSITGMTQHYFGWRALLALTAASLVLSACGGGSGSAPAPLSEAVPDPLSGLPETPGCMLLDRRSFLADQFRTEYFYNDLTPLVDPAPEQGLRAYFAASLFKGNERIPADRFSGYQTSEAYSQFYGEGKTLAYGLAVAGQEVQGRPDLPLFVRDVTPGSPAAVSGLQRGDRIHRLNDTPVEDAIAKFDFSMLTPQQAGQELVLEVERAGVRRTVGVTASVHDVVPVRLGRVINLPDGRRMGLVRFNSMITLAEPDLQAYFQQFRDQGVTELVFDLRYNGGGSVAVGGRVASMAAGNKVDGQVYAVLRNNAALQASNATYRFSSPVAWAGVKRVYVLTGLRTCSASEQMIAGLQGVGIDVVLVGSTTCGKPVGFRPREHCGLTYSLVNFDSVNARGEGGYYSGFAATCRVAEDFTKALEDPGEPLSAAAIGHARGQGCPAASGPDQQPLWASKLRSLPVSGHAQRDGPEWPGLMVP
ncbi:MAG: PDZ domain-containing protein [Betaproteobacteria bacterium]|nr:PDZ domain-containing protein [Betaproteobacteria bacterium]